jgi:hypothetical protein
VHRYFPNPFRSATSFFFIILTSSVLALISNRLVHAAVPTCDIEFTVTDAIGGNPLEDVQISVFTPDAGTSVAPPQNTNASGQCSITVPDYVIGTGCIPTDVINQFVYQTYKLGYYVAKGSIDSQNMSLHLQSAGAGCSIQTDKPQYNPGEKVMVTNVKVNDLASQTAFIAIYKPGQLTPYGNGQCVQMNAAGEPTGPISPFYPDGTQGEWTVGISASGWGWCHASGDPKCSYTFLIGTAGTINLNCSNSEPFRRLNAVRCACELGEDVEKYCDPTGCDVATDPSQCQTSLCAGCAGCPDPIAKASHPGKSGTWTAFGCIPNDPQSFLGIALSVVVDIAGGVAFLVLIRGALLVLTSQGNPEKIEQGKSQITSAIYGLLFLAFSTVILGIIGVDILRIPGFVR